MKITQARNRCSEEIIILTLSAVCCLAILPFSILRLIQSDWLIALLDSVMVLASGSLFIYVWKTGQWLLPGRILTFYCLSVAVLTVAMKGPQQAVWIFPALLASFFLLTTLWATLASGLTLVLIGWLLVDQVPAISLLQLLVSASASMIFGMVFSNRMRSQTRKLNQLAGLDPLTQVKNRRQLQFKLADLEYQLSRNKDKAISLVMLDIDKFKQLNDSLGHAAGDQVLIRLTQVLDKRLRQSDTLYRYGGEEFVIIAEDTHRDEASRLAESLRQGVERDPQLAENHVTISLGTAQLKVAESFDACLQRADKALYQAKHGGRNTCCVAS